MPLAKQTRQSLANQRLEDSRLRVSLERLIRRNEAILIALTIAAIAYGDWLAGPELSIGFLYLVPLSLCALTQSWQATAALVVPCVALRQILGPLELSPDGYFFRDLALTAVFLSLVSAMTMLSRRRREFFETARAQRDELIEEVRMAAEVQENIIQRNDPPQTGYDIVARMEPARVVGGDYYDFVRHLDGTLGIVIADVAGKGLSAAMLMPAVDIAIRTLAQSSSDPAKALESLNTTLYQHTGAANYATVFYGSLNTETGEMRFANGGHLPGLILRADAETVERLTASGMPVGLLPGAEFEAAQTRLEPGDLLILYSDGVVEEEDAEENPFGEERLVAAALAARAGDARSVVREIRRAVREFRAGENPMDDSTVIVVKAPA